MAYHHGLFVPEKLGEDTHHVVSCRFAPVTGGGILPLLGLRKYAATKTAEDIRVAVADYSDKVHKAGSFLAPERSLPLCLVFQPGCAGLVTEMPIVLTSSMLADISDLFAIWHLHGGSNRIVACEVHNTPSKLCDCAGVSIAQDSPKDACKYLQIEEFRCLNVAWPASQS